MWIADLSENAANTVYSCANLALVIGSVLALAGTIGAVWSGSIRERYAQQKLSDNVAATASAEEAAASANERAQRVALDLAQQQERAAKAEADLIDLKQRVKSRHLTAGQRQQLMQMLQQKPKASLYIVWEGDEETHDFALEISSAVKEAGWESDLGQRLRVTDLGPARGLYMWYANPIPGPAEALHKILTDIGLEVGLSPYGSKPDEWYLYVGLRRSESRRSP